MDSITRWSANSNYCITSTGCPNKRKLAFSWLFYMIMLQSKVNTVSKSNTLGPTQQHRVKIWKHNIAALSDDCMHKSKCCIKCFNLIDFNFCIFGGNVEYFCSSWKQMLHHCMSIFIMFHIIITTKTEEHV